MFNYDPSTHTMRNKINPTNIDSDSDSLHSLCVQMLATDKQTEDEGIHSDAEPPSQDEVHSEVADSHCQILCEQKISQCEDGIKLVNVAIKQCKEELMLRRPQEKIYLKRIVSALFRQLSTFDIPTDEPLQYHMTMTLDTHAYESLELYAESNDGFVQDAHDILSTRLIVLHATPQDSWSTHVPFYIGITVQVAVIVLCVSGSMYIHSKLRLSLIGIIMYLLLISLAISFPWTWYGLYEKKIAERHAEALKDMPASCRTQSMTTMESLWASVTSQFKFADSECVQYYEKLLVNPLLEVPPSLAIATTLTTLCLEPLEHIGIAMQKLLKGLFEGLPLHLIPVAIVLLVMIVFLLLIMLFGYRIKLFHFFGIEPANENRSELRHLKNRIDEVDVSNKNLVQRNDVLTAANHNLVTSLSKLPISAPGIQIDEVDVRNKDLLQKNEELIATNQNLVASLSNLAISAPGIQNVAIDAVTSRNLPSSNKNGVAIKEYGIQSHVHDCASCKNDTRMQPVRPSAQGDVVFKISRNVDVDKNNHGDHGEQENDQGQSEQIKDGSHQSHDGPLQTPDGSHQTEYGSHQTQDGSHQTQDSSASNDVPLSRGRDYDEFGLGCNYKPVTTRTDCDTKL